MRDIAALQTRIREFETARRQAALTAVLLTRVARFLAVEDPVEAQILKELARGLCRTTQLLERLLRQARGELWEDVMWET